MKKRKILSTAVAFFMLLSPVVQPAMAFATESTSSYASSEQTSSTEGINQSSTSTTDDNNQGTSSNTTTTSDSSTESTTTDSESSSSSSSSSSSESSSSESTTTSSTGSSSSTTTQPSSSSDKPTKPSQPKPEKPKPDSNKPGPSKPGEKPKDDSTTGDTSSIDIGELDGDISMDATPLGEDFIEIVAEDAAEIANENGIYASVMIAQACLETGFGGSKLAQGPNYNLFGIKGDYKGHSVSMSTMEDSADGMYTTQSSFRKYPSYKESFEDYAELITKGIPSNPEIYKGAWKSDAKTYKDATKYLTGRYATDRNYDKKLNAIIEAYKLDEYDDGSKLAKKEMKYMVAFGDTLNYIAKNKATTVESILKLNPTIKDRNLIYAGNELVISEATSKRAGKSIFAIQGKFNLPLPKGSYIISSGYGNRDNPTAVGTAFHKGIDLAAPMNSKIYASREGEVVDAGRNSSAGNYVIIKHADNVYTSYFHMNSVAAKTGTKVKAGDCIGFVGSTGDSTGAHLHFAISAAPWKNFVDPTQYVKF